MGKTWSWNSPWDLEAMSNYNTITSLAESPKQEGLIYAGTDDGLIQITEDGGATWRKIEVSQLPGAPATAFVNDIKADLYDANTVYIALDNHKYGDFSPYLYKSNDKGKSWSSIKSNLPKRTLVWRIVQDHIKKDLFFLGTEFGIYVSLNAGSEWLKLTGGVPTISFRDLAIQKRENDLVGASFGRGFFILDDYSVFREVNVQQLDSAATLFPVRKAWWYIQRPVLAFNDEKGSQGASYYTAPNPPFGAVFTYYLKEELKTKKDVRLEKEKELVKQNKNVSFPGWDEVEAERRQQKPRIWLTVKDNNGNVVRRIEGCTKKGFHRVNWDLRYPSVQAIGHVSDNYPEGPHGVMAGPGDYTVALSKEVDGIITELAGPVPFKVVQLRKGALKGATSEEIAEFRNNVANLQKSVSAASVALQKAINKAKVLQEAIDRTPEAAGELHKKIHQVKKGLMELDEQMNGNRSKNKVGEKNDPTIKNRLRFAQNGTRYSSYGPTPEHKKSLELAKKQFKDFKIGLEIMLDQMIPELEKAMQDAGAPWTEGQPIPE